MLDGQSKVWKSNNLQTRGYENDPNLIMKLLTLFRGFLLILILQG
jgi:hypothetical protein